MKTNVIAGMALLAMSVVSAQPKPPAPEELKALQEIVNATNVDARVAAADNFVKSFPKSEYRPFALTMAAEAYEMSGNVTKAIIYYQQVLEASPKDYNAMLMLAAETARTTREFDLDKEEKLAKAEKFAKDGMALVPAATKPNPQLTDAQWEDLKKDDLARGHEALGMIALARKSPATLPKPNSISLMSSSSLNALGRSRLSRAWMNSVGDFSSFPFY